MTQRPDGTFHSSQHGLTVTALVRPGDARCVDVCLAGEIDMAAFATLSETVNWLIAQAPVYVRMDLAALTFACSTLPNFVVQIRHAVPDIAELVLWRAGPAASWVLQVTDMAAIATLHDEPVEPVTAFAA